jgi:hypothetical protein
MTARLAVLATLILTAAADAQAARLASPTAAESLLQGSPAEGKFAELASPPIPTISAAPGPASEAELLPRFDFTYLPRQGGLGVTDLEAGAEIRLPFDADLPPLKIIPGFAAHLWDGPARTNLYQVQADLPGATYDLYADLQWRPRPAEWLFVDLRLTPGIYTDGDNWSQAFRLRGHALAMVAFSEQFQIIGGVVYANRVRRVVVPAGGIRWAPDEDTEFRLVFPAPRISRRVADVGGYRVRLYASGEFGGGSWGIRRADGVDDEVEYGDIRVLLGVEAESPAGRSWHAEVGYAFDRRLDYASTLPPTARFGPTMMFRVGTSY